MEIKNCPFCGKQGKIITPEKEDFYKFQVKCCNPICNMSKVITFRRKTRDQAIKDWNMRL